MYSIFLYVLYTVPNNIYNNNNKIIYNISSI